MLSDIKKFSQLLRDHKVSVTKSRIEVFETLLKAEKPLKNGEVIKRTPSVDRVSVYRTLELFADLGITETTIHGWTPLTELAEPFKSHHHHMTCECCGQVIEVDDGVIEDVLATIASKYGFKINKHIVELAGLCAACRRELA